MRRWVAALAAGALLVLTGCATRDDVLTPVDVTAASGSGKSVVVLVATTRARAEGSDLAFTTARAEELNFQEYVVSIPPGHLPGRIEWSRTGTGNPATDFVVTSNRRLTETQFAGAIAGQLVSDPAKMGDVTVFVHGYNTSLPEAVFRMAEIGADVTPAAGVMVLFTWPSRASLLDYGTDRESVTYSRDPLETVLNRIAAIRQVDRVYLGAHSMGNFAVVEALRQARFKNSPFLGKLGLVGLIAPDIDFDVFHSQIDVIGRLKFPILVVIARDDRALAASQLIAGGVSRVGNVLLDDPAKRALVERHGLQIVDMSEVNSDDAFAHSKYADAIGELDRIAVDTEGARRGSRYAPGVFVLDGSGQTVSTPSRTGDARSR